MKPPGNPESSAPVAPAESKPDMKPCHIESYLNRIIISIKGGTPEDYRRLGDLITQKLAPVSAESKPLERAEDDTNCTCLLGMRDLECVVHGDVEYLGKPELSSDNAQAVLQKEFDAEDVANLARIAHVPDNKLRDELAVCTAELEGAHDFLDHHLGLDRDGMTSLETLSDRLRLLLSSHHNVSGALPVPEKQDLGKTDAPSAKTFETQIAPSESSLLEWLRGKIADAEAAVRFREQSEEVLKSGDDASWERAAAMHPQTAGKAMSKAGRDRAAASHASIAIKCRREVEMFKAVENILLSLKRGGSPAVSVSSKDSASPSDEEIIKLLTNLSQIGALVFYGKRQYRFGENTMTEINAALTALKSKTASSVVLAQRKQSLEET